MAADPADVLRHLKEAIGAYDDAKRRGRPAELTQATRDMRVAAGRAQFLLAAQLLQAGDK